jgi:transposase-like protein
MVRIVRESDRTSVTDAAKKHGVSEQTLYTWHRKFGNVDVADAKRMKGLEAENAQLKKLMAERNLEVEAMKEINARKW